MVRLTLKSLVANRVRLALTTFAVVLAVSFVASSFVLTDGIRSTFDDVSSEVAGDADLEVRAVEEFGQPERLDESMLDKVTAIEGVATAAPVVEADGNTIRPVKPDGELITTNGPPQLAFGWSDSAAFSVLTLAEGEAPAGDEFVMDIDSAANHGFEVGNTYDVQIPTGRTQLTLTGLVSYGEDNSTAGAILMSLPIDTLHRLTATTGYDSIRVLLEPGTSPATAEAVLAGLAPGIEVVDNATIVSEAEANFNGQVDIFRNVMLGFAGLSLFVSVFIIYNTFSIMLGQRTREMALLRTIGADPVQLRRSVLAEAVGVGVVASILGIGGGVALRTGLITLFGGLGDTPLVISRWTVFFAFAVGVGVTVMAAIGPARRASRVPAMAALRDGADAGEPSGRLRLIVGTALLALGIAACGAGLFAASTTGSVVTLLAAGAAGVFLGITMVSPLATVPLTRVLGWPLRQVSGVSGRLAEQNAGRNPHRTATTAAALMIGLALVSMALTVGESAKTHLRDTLTSSVRADYIISLFEEGELPPALAEQVAASPVTDTVSTFRLDEIRVAGETNSFIVAGTDHEATAELFDFGIVEGVAADPTVTDPVLVHQDEAEARDLGVGDTLTMEFASGQSRDLEVIGIHTDATVAGPIVVDDSTWDAVGANEMVNTVSVALAEGVSQAEADAAFAPIADEYPQAEFNTSGEFVDRLEGFIDQALTVINALVALAVIIALLGIANTLALSVFERTRELGLLRAVGMTRRQLRRMVRVEAVLVALFGSVLGVVTGIAFGWAAVEALPDSFTSTLSVPTLRIALLVAVAGAAGVAAAWGPARRASRLNVLNAISH